MKLIKKIAAMALTGIMCLSSSIPAIAATSKDYTSKQNNVTIEIVDTDYNVLTTLDTSDLVSGNMGGVTADATYTADTGTYNFSHYEYETSVRNYVASYNSTFEFYVDPPMTILAVYVKSGVTYTKPTGPIVGMYKDPDIKTVDNNALTFFYLCEAAEDTDLTGVTPSITFGRSALDQSDSDNSETFNVQASNIYSGNYNNNMQFIVASAIDTDKSGPIDIEATANQASSAQIKTWNFSKDAFSSIKAATSVTINGLTIYSDNALNSQTVTISDESFTKRLKMAVGNTLSFNANKGDVIYVYGMGNSSSTASTLSVTNADVKSGSTNSLGKSSGSGARCEFVANTTGTVTITIAGKEAQMYCVKVNPYTISENDDTDVSTETTYINQSFTISPDTESVTIDGQSVSNNGSLSLVQGNTYTVSAPDGYTVSSVNGESGNSFTAATDGATISIVLAQETTVTAAITIDPSAAYINIGSTQYKDGENISLTVGSEYSVISTDTDAYTLNSITVNDETITAVDGKCTFTATSSSTTITASLTAVTTGETYVDVVGTGSVTDSTGLVYDFTSSAYNGLKAHADGSQATNAVYAMTDSDDNYVTYNTADGLVVTDNDSSSNAAYIPLQTTISDGTVTVTGTVKLSSDCSNGINIIRFGSSGVGIRYNGSSGIILSDGSSYSSNSISYTVGDDLTFTWVIDITNSTHTLTVDSNTITQTGISTQSSDVLVINTGSTATFDTSCQNLTIKYTAPTAAETVDATITITPTAAQISIGGSTYSNGDTITLTVGESYTVTSADTSAYTLTSVTPSETFTAETSTTAITATLTAVSSDTPVVSTSTHDYFFSGSVPSELDGTVEQDTSYFTIGTTSTNSAVCNTTIRNTAVTSLGCKQVAKNTEIIKFTTSADGATLYLLVEGNGSSARTVTVEDSDGNYSNTEISAPAKSSGTATLTVASITLGSAGTYTITHAGGDVRYYYVGVDDGEATTGTINATVQDQNGNALSGATVSCGDITATTDTDGTATLSKVEAGDSLEVSATYNGDTGSNTVNLTAGSSADVTITITLTTGTITATVKDQNSNAITGAEILFVSGGDDVTWTDNGDGTYTSSSIAAGTYQIYASLDGSESTTADVTVVAGQNVAASITTTRTTGEIQVNLTDTDGSPLIDAVVTATDTGKVYSLTEESDGVYIGTVPASTYTISAVYGDVSGTGSIVAENAATTSTDISIALSTVHSVARHKMSEYSNIMLKNDTSAPKWNTESGKWEVNNWHYVNGAVITAMLDMAEATEKTKYSDFAVDIINYVINADGSFTTDSNISNFIYSTSRNRSQLDGVREMTDFQRLYDITSDSRYTIAADYIYNNVLDPITQVTAELDSAAAGSYSHKSYNYPYQIWLDGFFMGFPFYMQYAVNANDTDMITDVYTQYSNLYNIARDSETGLYYHGYNASDDELAWATAHDHSESFWLRAMAWLAMAYVDTLEIMPEGTQKENMKTWFKEYMTAVVKYQDSDTGMWYQVVDEDTSLSYTNDSNITFTNYLETSGSAGMAAALMKGYRLGYLDISYYNAGVKAFDGICANKLYYSDTATSDIYAISSTYSTTSGIDWITPFEVTSDNNSDSANIGKYMVLKDICRVAGLGSTSTTNYNETITRDGSPEYYIQEFRVDNDGKAIAPLMMAYSEVIRHENGSN